MIAAPSSPLDSIAAHGYSLPTAAAALHLSPTTLADTLDESSLARLEALSHRLAALRLLETRMAALGHLVQVCQATDNLREKRLAAQAILRFDPFAPPRAATPRIGQPRSPAPSPSSPFGGGGRVLEAGGGSRSPAPTKPPRVSSPPHSTDHSSARRAPPLTPPPAAHAASAPSGAPLSLLPTARPSAHRRTPFHLASRAGLIPDTS